MTFPAVISGWTILAPRCNTGNCARPAGCVFPNTLLDGPKGDFVALLRHPQCPRRAGPCTGQQPLPQAERKLFFARLQPGDCARPAGCAFPYALAGRALAQDSSLFRKRKENCFLSGCNQGIVLALRAVHSPTPSPGGPLHRIAALSIRRGLLFYAPAQASLAGHKNNNSLPQCGKLQSCAVKGGFEPPVRKPVRQFSKLLV